MAADCRPRRADRKTHELKAKLSKDARETLEQHCEIEFNRISISPFNAYFEKDNDASFVRRVITYFVNILPKGLKLFRSCSR